MPSSQHCWTKIQNADTKLLLTKLWYRRDRRNWQNGRIRWNRQNKWKSETFKIDSIDEITKTFKYSHIKIDNRLKKSHLKNALCRIADIAQSSIHFCSCYVKVIINTVLLMGSDTMFSWFWGIPTFYSWVWGSTQGSSSTKKWAPPGAPGLG